MLKTDVHLELTNQEVFFPRRSTHYSAGYDIFASENVTIPAYASISWTLPFTLHASPSTKERLQCMEVVRSSYGIKKRLRIQNERGEYINRALFPLDGTPMVLHLYNDSDESLTIRQNDHFLQFLLVQQEEERQPVSFEKVSEATQKAFPSVGFTLSENRRIYTLETTSPLTFLPNEQKLIPTGYKASFEKGTWLGANIAGKHENKLLFANATPVIDADYYNNPDNEGLIFIAIVNTSDEAVTLSANEAICDFVAMPFYVLDNEMKTENERTGGIGSTTKR